MKQKIKYSEDAYRFASAKISAMSMRLMTPAMFSSLCDVGSSRTLRDRMNECGITVTEPLPEDTLEGLLTAYLQNCYAELASFLPDTEICALMQARFDCHNLKTAIKCRKAGLSPAPYFILCGKFSAKQVTDAVETADFSAFPKIISEAASAAYQAYAENASARTVDTVLDAACFSYMAVLAKILGCRPVSEILSLKADLINLITLFRIRKISNAEIAKQLAADSYVTGGSLSPEKLQATESNQEAGSLFAKILSPKRFLLLLQAIGANASVDDIAALCDNIFYSEAMERSKESLLGIYPIIAYIIRLEYQVKNIRILASGLDAGETPEKLREELRGYV